MNMMKTQTFSAYEPKQSCIEVKTTFNNKEEAQCVAEILLDKKLIACGQIFDIESHYIWQGQREITQEYCLVMKARKNSFVAIENEIKKHHSYDCPEIVAIDLADLSLDYCKWIYENTGNPV